MAEERTNVMHILDQKRVPYILYYYAHPNGAVDGASMTALLDRGSALVYKTPVTQGASRQHCAFVIPIFCLLDLRAAAQVVGEKFIEMIPQARLFPLTSYVHRDCSPVGAKKPFPIMLDGSVEGPDAIVVSAGKIGVQVELAPIAFCTLVGGTFASVSK